MTEQSVPEMKGIGKPGGLMVVLDWPSSYAWRKKEHLSGDELKLVTAVLKGAGFDTKQIYVTFAVKEQIEERFDKKGKRKKLTPTDRQMERAAMRLAAEVEQIQPKKLLLMGGTAWAVAHGEISPVNPVTKHGLGEWYTTLSGRKIYTVTTMPAYYITSTPDYFRDLVNDVYKLYERNAPEPLPLVKEVVVRCLDDLLIALASLKAASYVTCDTETSGLHPWEDKIEAIGIGAMFKGKDGRFKVKTIIIPWELLEDVEIKKATMDFLMGRTYHGYIVFHNAKFDLQFLTMWGGECLLDMKVRDTLLMNYLIDERPIADKTSPHGLKNLSRVRYDAWEYKFDFDEFWSLEKEDRDWATLYSYLSLDLYYTARLYYDLLRELPEDSPKFLDILDNLLMPATKSLAEIELEGVYIDRDYLRALGVEWTARMTEVVAEANVILRDQLHIDNEWIENFNIGSPTQVSELLYQKLYLPSKRRKKTEDPTDEKTLNELIYNLANTGIRSNWEPIRDFIDLLLEYRGLKKMVGTYVEGLLKQADARGRIHGSFNLAGTSTGRLSASNPNLQNIPAIKGLEIRRAFMAPEGYSWLKIDGSQLEYRMTALITQDAKMIQAFIDKRDIHVEVASAALGVAPHDVTKPQRYAAKFIGFGILYGRQAYSIANGPELRGQNWTEKRAQNFIDGFLAQFTGLKDFMDNQKRLVSDAQLLEAPLGRRRRWPYLTNQEKKEAERQALNFPIQSTASDFTLSGLVAAHRFLKPYKTRIVVTVHDEIDFIVADTEKSWIIQKILDVIHSSAPIDTETLPVEWGADWGPNWGSLVEWPGEF